MPQITINGKPLHYVETPLAAYYYDGECWAGRSNCEPCNAPASLQFNSLDECFQEISRWKIEAGSNYRYGYVMDYDSFAIYYDQEEALQYLTRKVIPKQKLDGYFQKFVQKKF